MQTEYSEPIKVEVFIFDALLDHDVCLVRVTIRLEVLSR